MSRISTHLARSSSLARHRHDVRIVCHAWLVLACAVAVGCGESKPVARVDVIVLESSGGLGRRLDRIELSVQTVGEGAQLARTAEHRPVYGTDGMEPWIERVGPITPSHIGRLLYRFRVTGFAGGVEVIRRQHRVVFVAGTTMTLRVRLDARCVQMPCESVEDSTCVEGACVDDLVPGCTFFPGDLPAICESMDASVDAARDMGPTADADAADADAADARDAADASDAGCDGGPCGCGDAGPCAAGRICCRGACVDPTSDTAHCGACERACETRQTCRAGACACVGGFGDCRDDQPGCETDLSRTREHCGGCGNGCPIETPTCIDGTCSRCVTDADCPAESAWCVEPPACVAGECRAAVLAGWCAVTGECFENGALSSNPCFVCDTAASQREWTQRPDGTPCTRDVCIEAATCSEGRCTGGVPASCDDGLACTTDSCDREAGGCVHVGGVGSCTFGGRCYAEGDWHPSGRCERCSSGTWIAQPDGTTCDDGLWCTDPGVCAGGMCPQTLQADRCLIDGECYWQGQWDPDRVCFRHCNSWMTTTEWTNIANSEGWTCGTDMVCASRVCTPCPPGRHDCTYRTVWCECDGTCSGETCIPTPTDAGTDAETDADTDGG